MHVFRDRRNLVKAALALCAMLFIPCGFAFARQSPVAATPLATLVKESEGRNAEVAAAKDTWKASTHVAKQVSTPPDPQFTFQSLSVGNPEPTAGFGSSNFAYLGLGASQELPYFGKLKLKGEVANREADTQKASAGVVRSSVAGQVKVLYLRLAYLQAKLEVLDRTDAVLQPLVKDALSRYSVGQGDQAGVIRAQMQRTRILREKTAQQEQTGEAQADLKQLLHRAQDSPDIVPEELTATPLKLSQGDLQALVRGENPTLRMDAAAVAHGDAQVKSARREGKPDFNLGYMYQLTGSAYSDYYMLTVSMRLPRRGRVSGEIQEAAEQANHARDELDSQTQQTLADVQKQCVTLTSTQELLDEYRQGLIPQAEAVLRSEQAAYAANKGEFAPVLASLLDLLTLEDEYQQSLLEHETALARLETLTGATLR